MHEHHRDRLRQKLLDDKNVLNEYEVMELLLFSAIPRKNTNDIAHRLIDRFGSVLSVLKATPDELMLIEGIGKNAASFLTCLGMIVTREEDRGAFPKFFEFSAVRPALIEAFTGYKEEIMMVFFLDHKRKILSRRLLTSGSTSRVDIDLTEISRRIVLAKPAYVAVAHNHPGGSYRLSFDDDVATEKLCMVCALNNASFIDHIIVADENVYSYHYDGRLDLIRERVEDRLV